MHQLKRTTPKIKGEYVAYEEMAAIIWSGTGFYVIIREVPGGTHHKQLKSTTHRIRRDVWYPLSSSKFQSFHTPYQRARSIFHQTLRGGFMPREAENASSLTAENAPGSWQPWVGHWSILLSHLIDLIKGRKCWEFSYRTWPMSQLAGCSVAPLRSVTLISTFHPSSLNLSAPARQGLP